MTGTLISHARAAFVVVALAEIGGALYIPPAPGAAGRDGRGFRQGFPTILGKGTPTGGSRSCNPACPGAGSPGELPVVKDFRLAGIEVPGKMPRRTQVAAPGRGPSVPQVGANQAAFGSLRFSRPGLLVRIKAIIIIGRAAADLDPYGFPAAAAFLLGEFKDAFRADAGDTVFAIGEPAFLPGGEAAEAALPLGAVVLGAVPVVVGVGVIIDLALGPGVGLVEGAVEGFAAVGGEGFEDAGSQFVVGVGYGGTGLPIGAVPADEAGSVGRRYVEQVFREGVAGRWRGSRWVRRGCCWRLGRRRGRGCRRGRGRLGGGFWA